MPVSSLGKREAEEERMRESLLYVTVYLPLQLFGDVLRAVSYY